VWEPNARKVKQWIWIIRLHETEPIEAIAQACGRQFRRSARGGGAHLTDHWLTTWLPENMPYDAIASLPAAGAALSPITAAGLKAE
jgi:hypothetical protein